MNNMRLLLISIALLILPFESWGADYTGFWKTDCKDGFGVQIKPVGNQMYSVSFCGPGGCFEPGEWMPNTPIEGDPNYKVISPEKVAIRKDAKLDYFTYIKCTSDPTWTVAKPPSPPIAEIDCSFTSNLKEEGTLIAWVTDCRITTQFGNGMTETTTQVGPFRPLAILNGSSIKETLGATIHKGQSFWPVLPPNSKPIKLISVDSFFDHMNDGRCVYFGSLDKTDLPRWTLLSNVPLTGVFRSPTQKDRDEFYRMNTTCVRQGDYPEGKEPPCVRPILLAISDINKNGKPEYWATEPYIWDTGLTIWENTGGTLLKLFEVCVGCSD
jgi:hypothetical protein